jgi:hypothetical protein
MVAVLLAVGAALLVPELMQGWFPQDEGLLGQAAERTLQGEWPHRDFDDTYTVALTWLHAATFAVLGVSASAMRWPLFVAALLWLAALYRVTRRFTSPAWSAGIALTAFVWSVPSYPAAMPSWYVLFLATFAVLGFLRYLESGRLSSLFGVGLAGGVAFLFKLPGVLVIVGAGVAYLATLRVAPVDEERDVGRGPPAMALTLCLLAAAVAIMLITGREGVRQLVRFAVPMTVLLTALALRFARVQRAVPWSAFRGVPVLLLGAAVPVLIVFLVFYLGGGLGAFIDGVFITPFRRTSYATHAPPALWALWAALPVALVLWVPSRSRRVAIVMTIAFTAWCVAIIMGIGSSLVMYWAGWYAAWSLLFFVAADAARLMLQRAPSTTDGRLPLALASFAVPLALLEYPFAVPFYTLYAWPLALVAVCALTQHFNRVAPGLRVVGLAALLVFGLHRIVPASAVMIGRIPRISPETALLDLPRGGLRVAPRDSALFADLIPFVRSVAGDRPIWAGPDAPEIYFFAELRNHTRTIFDFLEADSIAAIPLVDRLAAIGAEAVVIKAPQFSLPLADATIAQLRGRYPQGRTYGIYEVRWR